MRADATKLTPAPLNFKLFLKSAKSAKRVCLTPDQAGPSRQNGLAQSKAVAAPCRELPEPPHRSFGYTILCELEPRTPRPHSSQTRPGANVNQRSDAVIQGIA